MTLVSRDQMPATTPYEAELRVRLEGAERQAALFQRLAVAQDRVIRSARQAVDDPSLLLTEWSEKLATLREELQKFDIESGRIMLDMMPPEIRAALTSPSGFEEALKAQKGSLFAATPPAPPAAEAAAPAPRLNLDGFERALAEAGPMEVNQLAGRGWPSGWADLTGISDQEIVWPVQPKGEPIPGGQPIAAFASPTEQALYWWLRNNAPQLLAVARAAEALRDVTVALGRYPGDAPRANELLERLRSALGG